MARWVWRPRNRRVLRLGDEGSSVAWLQERLQSLGYEVGAIDGSYGFLTEDCICSLQREHGLRVDGIAGPEVMELLHDPEIRGLDRKVMVWGASHGDLGDLSRALGHDPHLHMEQRINGLLLYCFSINDDGSISGELPATDYPKTGSKQMKLVPVISNLNQDVYDEFAVEALLRHSHTRKWLLETVRRVVANPRIDGVGLDLQKVGLGYGRRFAALLHEARDLVNHYHKRMYMVLIPASGNLTLPRNVDRRIWRTVPDRVILQASRQYVEGQPGPKLGIKWMQKQLEKVWLYLPPWKLIVALPVDGVAWRVGDAVREYNYLSYDEVRKLAYQKQAKIQWDTAENVPYCDFVGAQGRFRVWFENRDSMRPKLEWLSNQHLAGVAFMPIGGEDSRIWREIENLSIFTDIVRDGLAYK
ncbi:MAG: hypothetical protein GX998_11155 [Firmicutes bacterium]|nr:hypothetical protein [Bacillota bacterium]